MKGRRGRADPDVGSRAAPTPIVRREADVEPGAGRAGRRRSRRRSSCASCRADEFIIEKGLFFPKDYVRISKTPRTVEQRADAEVRREEVKIDREGDLTERGDGSVKEPEE